MSQAIKPTEEQKKFAADIANKLYTRYRNANSSAMSESVKAMIAHHLAKEGWSKEDPSAALEMDVER